MDCDMKSKGYFLLTVFLIFLCIPYSLGTFDNFFIENINEKYYSQGDFFYTGNILAGNFEGQGELMFSNGSTYEGILKKGFFNGEFTYLTEDKFEVHGIFQNKSISNLKLTSDEYNAELDSISKVSYSNIKGWSYTGEFDSWGQNGYGTLIWADNSKYVGCFKHGLAEGDGTYYSKDGNVIYQGNLKNGLFHGYGYYSFNSTQYIGDFENGLPEGKGIYKSPQDWSYEGYFKQGVFDGEGTVTDEFGNKFTGTWEQGKRVV